MLYPPNCVYLSGNARVSETNAIITKYKKFFISVVIDSQTNIILDAQATTVLKITNDFIAQLLVGHNIIDELDKIILNISSSYFGLSQKAIMAAVKDIYNQYSQYKSLKL